MVSIFFALIFGHALLFHFCTCEGRSQHSVVDIQVHCPILGTHFPWKICPRNANKQRPFFLQTHFFSLRAVQTASESTGKCVQSTEISIQFGPVRTKRTFCLKRTFFFHVRPSISQNCFSAVGTTRSGRADALKPCVYFAEVSQCANVCPRSSL